LFDCVYASVEATAKKYARHEDLSSDDATVIWTGDGAIVALKAPFDHLAPLHLTARFRALWNARKWPYYLKSAGTKIPQLHVAAHTGFCRWLRTPTLRSPLFECSNCFGVDLNVLSRLAQFSGPGDFVTSEELVHQLNLVDSRCRVLLDDASTVEFEFDHEPQTGTVSGKGTESYTYRMFRVVHREESVS
jgi:hypothetical protein